MFNFSEQFIDKLINKDSDSFNIFYNDTVNTFFRYLKWNYYISDEDCYDLISTLYLKIWNWLDNYKHNNNFSSWVWTIFKNLILDYFKVDKYLGFSEIEEKNEDNSFSFEEILESWDNVINNINNKFIYNQIIEAINSLDEIYKEILHLKFVEQLSYEEISELTNISNENVRKRLSRAIKMLKQNLNIE